VGPGSPSGQHRAAGDLGYLLFGPSAGLAWYWWFSPFFCFSTVFLALRIILRGHDFLSAFGALWFSSSAYLVCWSHFPAYTVGFAAMGMVAVYHLITTRTLRGALLAGLAAGYAHSGIPAADVSALDVPLASRSRCLVGLFVRDRLWKQIIPRNLACGLGLAAVLAGVTSWCSSWPCSPSSRLSRQRVSGATPASTEATCRWPASSAACTTGTPFACPWMRR